MVKTKDCQVRVLYADTDAMGIVYNGTYIAWLEKGRTEWLRQAGYSYKKIEEMGLLLPVSHIDIEYRHPAHYDDLLTIKTWIEKNLIGTNNPRQHGKGLMGNKSEYWRYRVGDYRILAEIRDAEVIIIIVEVGHRREIYKR